MKKILTVILLAFYCLGALAADLDLPIMKAFDGRFNNMKGVVISEILEPSKSGYYYIIEVKGNKDVIKKVRQLFDQTQKKVGTVSKRVVEKKETKVLEIKYQKKTIVVGLVYDVEKNLLRVFTDSQIPLN